VVDLKARGEAGAARSKTMTLWQSLKTDLRNAGSEWVDEEAVVDGKLVTSRKPDVIPAFNKATIETLGRLEEKLATTA
jgi:protease I